MKPACTATFRLAALVLGAACLCHGQSLGEVAREQRQKQARKDRPAAQPAKVITDEDLPSRSDLAVDETTNMSHAEAPSPPRGTKSAEQWKAEIAGQKKVVENLQDQITRLSSSIHYVDASRYWSGPQHNRRQDQKQEQVERMQAQLADQQKKLEVMQESSRKEGFGNAVYDP